MELGSFLVVHYLISGSGISHLLLISGWDILYLDNVFAHCHQNSRVMPSTSQIFLSTSISFCTLLGALNYLHEATLRVNGVRYNNLNHGCLTYGVGAPGWLNTLTALAVIK